MHDSSLALATRLFMAMACCRHCYYLQTTVRCCRLASPLLSVLPFPLWPLSSFSLSFSPLLLCGLCSRFDDTSDSDRRFHHLIGGRGRHLPWPSLHFARCLFACVRAFYCSAVSRHHLHSPSSSSPTPNPEALTTAAAPADICLPGRRRGERLRCWIRVYLPPHYLPLLLEPAWLGLSQRCWLLLRPFALPLLSSALLSGSLPLPRLIVLEVRTMLPACCA